MRALAWIGSLVCFTCGGSVWLLSGDNTHARVDVAPRRALEPRIELPEWGARKQVLESIRACFESRPTLGVAVHYLRLKDVLEADDPYLSRASELIRGYGSDCAPLVKTRTGVRYKEHAHKISAGPDQESHVGQAVAALAEIGAPGDTKVLVDGAQAQVFDIVEDLVANYYPGRFDLEWTLVALSEYWPNSDWRNRYGEPGSFEEAARALLDRDPIKQSCGGAHVLQALHAIVTNRSEFLSDETRNEIEERITAALDPAQMNKTPARPHISWQNGIPRLPRIPSPGPSLLIVGHLMELRLASRGATRGVVADDVESLNWLRSALESYVDKVTVNDICAVTHAFRAVSLAQKYCARGERKETEK